MNINFQNDPFLRLLINNSIDTSFWKQKAGSSSYGLQDDAVIALRKMGYDGTLGDMLFQYYTELTNTNSLMDAWAKLQNLNGTNVTIDFVGKVNGDGDNTRILKYGANAELMSPTGFTSEAVSGYAGISFENDASMAYWDIGSPIGNKPQICTYIDLSQYGTKNELIKFIKSLEVYQRIFNTEVFAFNSRTELWEYKASSEIDGNTPTIDLSDKLEDYINSNSIVIIGYITPNATDGVIRQRVQVDYFKLLIQLLK